MEHLAYSSACASAYRALCDGACCGLLTGAIACRCIRANTGRAARQIKDGCRRDNRDACYTHVDADVVFFQIAHHSTGRVKSKGAASCEHNGMHLLDHMHGTQQVSFSGCRGATSYIHASDGGCVAKKDGTTCAGLQISVVSYADACNVCNIIMHAGTSSPFDVLSSKIQGFWLLHQEILSSPSEG